MEGLDSILSESRPKDYVSESRDELAAGLRWLWDTKRYADVVLRGPEASLKAHAVVLSAVSPPFRAMLAGAFVEAQLKVVEVSNHPQQVLAKMLEFVYTGEIEIDDQDVMQLFMIADQFDIKELKGLCEEHVATGINENSVLGLLMAAKHQTADRLEHKCLQFIKQHPGTILAQSEFRKLPEDVVLSILQLDFCTSEQKVFEAVVDWGNNELERRNADSEEKTTLKEVLAEVIRHVRFVSLKKDFLQEVVLPLKILPQEMIVDVLMQRISDDSEEKDEMSLAKREDFFLEKTWLKPRGSLYKKRVDFADDESYGSYLKAVLRPGMLLRATATYENIQVGDIGSFIQFNSGFPPCQAHWRNYGSTYWLYWRDLEIIE
jgi:hypothetical protein